MIYLISVGTSYLAVAMLLLGAGAAQATTIAIDGNNVSRIDNLDVDGILYNVEFLLTTSDVLYGTSPKIFDFPSAGFPTAGTAATAVRDAFNVSPTLIETVGPVGGIQFDFFDIGFDTEAAGANTLVQRSVFLTIPDTWSEASPAIGVRDSFSGLTMYADFTVVPEPGTALLLGLGLTGLGVVGRSKRQESKATA